MPITYRLLLFLLMSMSLPASASLPSVLEFLRKKENKNIEKAC
jgi:hypothetical protein